ncbi:WG repeat-containing protein [Capnocytophaga genosp. AHN8471]|uniref:WG repeat-containing protein n=1 Tax=Capnocytophaga genosp. AHN8471 TaxID=327574 RepID=UPI001931C3B6|nr:WG repeat-containing protein [Capnocytophaga genosp. AHN8471]MBM0654623.1 WG repeat-containing protein [Capnocytophaga genosp. AHN8471]
MKHIVLFSLFLSLNFLGCQSPTTDKKINDVPPIPSESWKANYDWVEPIYGNSVVKVRKNHKFGLVDHNGKELIPVEYEDIESDIPLYENTENKVSYLASSRLWAKKEGKYGYLDEYGAVVIPFIYDGVKTFSGFMAAVKKGDKWGFINAAGEEKLPFIYDEAEVFYQGKWLSSILCLVKKDGKWGYINTKGIVIIPFAYDELDDFGTDDYCAAKKNGKWGYIDKNNKVIIPFIYDEVEDSDLKYIRVVKDGKEGIIDFNRKTVIPIDFYVINLLGDDAMRIFPTKETTIETCFLLDSLGNCIEGCEYIPEYYKTHKLFYP